MAKTAQSKAKHAASRATAKPKASQASHPDDAIALLEADHREVEGFFEKFENAKSDAEKKTLAGKICLALKVHTRIEEEIFYPAARDATHDDDLLDEATVEHACAKSLIAEIEAMQPDQPLYDAKVKVLSEQIEHHVTEEEEELFPETREKKLDLKALGAEMAARKKELMSELSPKN